MMNKKNLLIVFGVCLVFVGIMFVSSVTGNSMVIDDDIEDEVSVLYQTEIHLNEGWNLVSGFGFQVDFRSGELFFGSQDLELEDIGAIYSYSNRDNEYFLMHPEKSLEFETLERERDVCGDGLCSANEYLNSWCYSECYFPHRLDGDLTGSLEPIERDKITLEKNEHKTINLLKDSLKVYWTDESDRSSWSCLDEEYDNKDCIVLHYFFESAEDSPNYFKDKLFSSKENHEPNLAFGIGGYPQSLHLGLKRDLNLGEFINEIYVEVDYTDAQEVYELTFYETGGEFIGLNLEDTSYKQFIGQATWVYSEKSGKVAYLSIIPRLNKIELQSGWNFVSITPEMIGKDLSTYTENCDVTGVYFYNSELREWDSLNLGDDFESGMLGLGAIIKVANSCILGSGESDDSPPGLPENGGTECTDSDGGKNYYLKGFASASNGAGEDRCCLSIGSGSYDCTQQGDSVSELYCLSEHYVEDTFFECPNGCQDGACIQ